MSDLLSKILELALDDSQPEAKAELNMRIRDNESYIQFKGNNFGLILSIAHLIKKLCSDLSIPAPNEKKEEFALSMIGDVVKILGADEKENERERKVRRF